MTVTLNDREIEDLERDPRYLVLWLSDDKVAAIVYEKVWWLPFLFTFRSLVVRPTPALHLTGVVPLASVIDAMERMMQNPFGMFAAQVRAYAASERALIAFPPREA